MQVIVRGGKQVNPEEVEEALLAHPAVARAATFALRHQTLGEDVAAAVVLKPSATATQSELLEFLAGRLAAFKLPRRVSFFGGLPHNAAGKVNRPALSAIVETQSAALDRMGQGGDPDLCLVAAVMAMGSIPLARPGSAMKAVNTSGSRAPLFWCFNNPAKEMGALAAHLDPEQPLYGLFSGGWLLPKTGANMSKAARLYADEIISLFPDGPYAIGGNCRGAKVAIMIADILEASGRKIEKLCLLEHAPASLHGFDAKLLLMFGKQSGKDAYHAIRWGAPGWSEAFRRPPVIVWVPGAHGEFFRPYNVPSLARKLDRFLGDSSRSAGLLASAESSIIRAIHNIPMLFQMYKKAFKLWNEKVHGKKVKVNPFTGEPLT